MALEGRCKPFTTQRGAHSIKMGGLATFERKNENGANRHRRGVTAVEGLYFLGLPWQHTRGSALLGWVKDDAEYIAEQIASVGRQTVKPAPIPIPDAAEAPA